MTRILIADDHSAVRNGLKNIISSHFGTIEFGEATNSGELLNLLNESKWSLLILDINLHGRSGLEVLHQLKEQQNTVPVLVFSFYHEEQIALRAFQSGASAFLSKSVEDTELLTAVRRLLEGKKYVSAAASEILLAYAENPDELKPHERLSTREYETLLLLGSGKSLSSIADTLSISVSAVNTYRARILEKMKMKSNADLIYYVIENKLV